MSTMSKKKPNLFIYYYYYYYWHVELIWPTESMKQPHTKCPRVTRDLTSQDRVTRGPTYELSAKEKIEQETRWTTREKKSA